MNLNFLALFALIFAVGLTQQKAKDKIGCHDGPDPPPDPDCAAIYGQMTIFDIFKETGHLDHDDRIFTRTNGQCTFVIETKNTERISLHYLDILNVFDWTKGTCGGKYGFVELVRRTACPDCGGDETMYFRFEKANNPPPPPVDTPLPLPNPPPVPEYSDL
ncbi:secreted protein [Melampsora americana]|nr:secreted protein [Melampsora americana]